MPKRHRSTGAYEVGVPGFTHALRVPARGSLLFMSGVTARDVDGSIVGPGDITAQTRRVYHNLERILAEAGSGFSDVARIVTYLTDMDQLPAVHAVRSEYFREALPASTTVQVVALAHPDLLIEVEATAVLGE
jgi:enamine deaminase RidA (YjgF/YER057c/UK114 family)